jgi:hypothetical protein
MIERPMTKTSWGAALAVALLGTAALDADTLALCETLGNFRVLVSRLT